MRGTLLLFGLSIVLASCLSRADVQSPESATVSVSAGSFDRIHTVVSIDLPHESSFADGRLLAEDGREVAYQHDADGRLWFIIDSLKANETRTYRLTSGTVEISPTANASVADGSVTLSTDDRDVLTYHFQENPLPRDDIDPIYERGGYIHPVLTPSGVLVTDDYAPNHLHHHGIWAAWTNTRYEGRTPDFWNMGNGTGTVEPIELETSWSGPVHAGLRGRNRYVDLTGDAPETVLLETWETRLLAVPDSAYNLFDVRVVQVTAGDSALFLPEYHYGGVGFRGHRQWNGPENTVFLTSEGLDRSNGHATTARWCHIGGQVDGSWAGIAILGHPDNFRAPQPMRIHPDEPFFNFAPSQGGLWSIEPGDRYEARYRYVVYDGEPNVALIERLWNDYAYPPVVTLEHN